MEKILVLEEKYFKKVPVVTNGLVIFFPVENHNFFIMFCFVLLCSNHGPCVYRTVALRTELPIADGSTCRSGIYVTVLN